MSLPYDTFKVSGTKLTHFWLIFHVESESVEKNAKIKVLIFPIFCIKKIINKNRENGAKNNRKKKHHFLLDASMGPIC